MSMSCYSVLTYIFERSCSFSPYSANHHRIFLVPDQRMSVDNGHDEKTRIHRPESGEWCSYPEPSLEEFVVGECAIPCQSF